MEKILIIGGYGYIGSRLSQYLLFNNFDVDVVDLGWFGQCIPFYGFNVDYNTLDEYFLSKYKTIILLAGHSSVKMCENNTLSTFNNNVYNFVNLLSKIGKQQFIYASSSSIYGGLANQEMDESCDKYKALNPYDLSKYEIDSYAKISNDIEYYGLRFGTVNGYSPNFRDDIMLNSMYSSSIKNGVIQYSNAEIHRPILAINDLCDAVSSIIKLGDYSKRGIYNLASFNSTVGEIVDEASKILDVKLIKNDNRINVYDFTISTKLFQDNFGFKFNGSIKSILEEIIRYREQMIFTNRNSIIKYRI